MFHVKSNQKYTQNGSINVRSKNVYRLNQPPLFFNKYELNKLEKSEYKAELNQIRTEYDKAFNDKQALTIQLGDAIENKDEALINESRISLKLADEKTKSLRKGLTDLMQKMILMRKLTTTITFF